MKHSNRIWLMGVCAVVALFGTARWLHVRPVHAQQNEQSYDDGTFYIDSYVDVDTNYNLYVESDMEVEFDFDEDIDEIEVQGYADQDGSLIADGDGDGDDFDPAEVGGSLGVVDTGHEYV